MTVDGDFHPWRIGAMGRQGDVDQKRVIVISHDELVFLRVSVGLVKQLVGFEIDYEIAEEFVVPEIDGVKEAEIVAMNEPALRITQAFDDQLPNPV